MFCHFFAIFLLLFNTNFVKSEESSQLDTRKEVKSFLALKNIGHKSKDGRSKSIGEPVMTFTNNLSSPPQDTVISTLSTFVVAPAPVIPIDNSSPLPVDFSATRELAENESQISELPPASALNEIGSLLESPSSEYESDDSDENETVEFLLSHNDKNDSLDIQLKFDNSTSPTNLNVEAPKRKPIIPSAEIQFIPECGCRRKSFYPLENFDHSRLNSSCSDAGTHYASNQKVVSFSLPRAPGPSEYNRANIYKVNILENLHRMRYFYPGYSMRLYTDLPLDSNYCRFLCQNADLFWCDIRKSFGDQSKMLHSTWKFLPLGDPSVKLFLSRDISTFLNEREAAVVHDWLKLNKTFHLMRDKRRVHNFAMMGGLWGARNDLLSGDEGDKLRQQIILMSKTPRNKGYRFKSFDQDILSRVIFYPKKRDIVAYDSYHCRQWRKFTMVRPFPVQRKKIVVVDGIIANSRGNASAVVSVIKKKYKLTKCPVECRPSYGKDWDYC